MKEPTVFYYLEYTGKSPQGGSPFVVPFGYLVLVDGAYRLLPGSVIHLLPEVPVTRVRLGGQTAAANLVLKVPPTYPAMARSLRAAGTVRLHAVIARDGTVRSLEVLSGDPVFTQSTLDAVRQWRYRPLSLQGEPVEVDTVIDVVFSLRQ